jgi:glycosyltransferase involved in cell wall biosynthesis
MGGVDARLVVVGFGPRRSAFEAIAPQRTLFTGPLEHRHLAQLLPLADVTVVPSIFPEAFGMVAAEAAAAGSPPLVARHSGLAEVAAGLEEEYPRQLRHLAAFESGDIEDLQTKLRELLALSREDRTVLQQAARRAVVERWSWAGVARRLLQPHG